MGNICRSPTAQGVFEHLVRQMGLHDRVHVDSAGTHGYHVGEPPDPRAQQAARSRGYDLSRQRARQVAAEDFERFDYVLVMDQENLATVQALCPPDHDHKLALLMDYAPELGVREVPDPYYGGANGFERVLDMIETAARGLLEDVRRRLA